MVAVTFIDAPEHLGKEVCATTRFADRLRPTAPRLAEIAARGGKACCSDNGTPKRLWGRGTSLAPAHPFARGILKLSSLATARLTFIRLAVFGRSCWRNILWDVRDRSWIRAGGIPNPRSIRRRCVLPPWSPMPLPSWGTGTSAQAVTDVSGQLVLPVTALYLSRHRGGTDVYPSRCRTSRRASRRGLRL